ncbi:hypothetical protein DPEC_G00360010 [Dallia pectoralis]|uniref:Uncharacterized protein n=1 Tax=Dallia pectoralis TaxID=75939 RepID=A0ACC2F143_DALPE|nr:hypothetical protein DPEC_G00360010 [Dallia pectoralis]
MLTVSQVLGCGPGARQRAQWILAVPDVGKEPLTDELYAVTAGVCGQTSLCQTHRLQHPPSQANGAELQIPTQDQ